ncbi:unnamed protein product [Alopecurus aequalis]
MRNNGSYGFGPSLRKPCKKKEPTKLMVKSLKQLKRTRQYYRGSMSNTSNNDIRQGDDNVSKRVTSHVRLVPRTNSLTSSSRASNRVESLFENIKESMPSSSRVVRKNMSRPSSLKPSNVMGCLQNGIEKPNNGMDFSNKNKNGGAPPLKNIEKPVTYSSRPNNNMDSSNKNKNGGASSSRRNNGEASIAKNTKVPRSSPLRPNNDWVSPSTNIERPNNGSVPFVRNNDPLKSRPSHLKNRFSSASKDGSNSMPSISKKSHPSSILCNSRISAQNLNGESQKEDIPTVVEASNLTLKLKGNQATGANMIIHSASILEKNLSSRQVAKVPYNKEQHLESMDEHIQLDSRKRNVSLSEDGGTIDDKLRNRTKPLQGENNETREDDDTEESENYEPVWSGSIRISSSKNVSLAAHLSTKCCKEVWNLAASLQQEIIVTKLSRMDAWPKSFEASRPTDNNIALYFLPCEMRQDADLDQLVKEVVENDMVLQAVVGEAEMLIFPSILLPEQHKTFQGKPYLWAVFKRRKNKVTTEEAQQHGKGRCAQDEMGKQQASNCSVGKEDHRVTGVSTDIGLEAPEEMERQGMEQEQNPSLARAYTPSHGTEDPTISVTTSANHGQTHSRSSLAVPTGAYFGFVVKRNQRTEHVLREMQREGAVVVAMEGEMIGSGLGQATATGREENEMTPNSSAAMV